MIHILKKKKKIETWFECYTYSGTPIQPKQKAPCPNIALTSGWVRKMLRMIPDEDLGSVITV